MKESGSQPGGQFASLKEPDQKPAKLVANPLQPGQLVKLYKGSTGRYGTSLSMQQTQRNNSTVKLWKKLNNKPGKPDLGLGVKGV